jgi:hypothetical protein
MTSRMPYLRPLAAMLAALPFVIGAASIANAADEPKPHKDAEVKYQAGG